MKEVSYSDEWELALILACERLLSGAISAMIEYSINEALRLIRVRMSGSNSCADLERHYAEVYHDPRYNPALRTLVQVDEDTGGPIMTELPKVKVVMEMAAQSPGALKKWAVVIPSGFKRMVVEFMMKDLKVKPLEVRYFADETAALNWLDAS